MSESERTETPEAATHSWPRLRSRDQDDDDRQLAHGDEVLNRSSSPQSPGRFWRRQGEGDEPEVLEPHHPLMKRFQAALKAHLQRQHDRLSEEVLGLEAEIKGKRQEREELGLSLYELQQSLGKQRQLISSCHQSLAALGPLREDMEVQVQASRNLYKSEQHKLNVARNKEEELRSELESLTCLERQFAAWERDMEAELAVSERISDKTKVDKKKLTDDMKKKDMFILRLMTEVANLEARLFSLDGQFQLKDEERQRVGQAVADANMDLDLLNREQRRLVQSWNSVLVSIHQRDQLYTRILTEHKKVQEQFRTLTNDIETYKRASNEEMQRNERLTITLNKVKAEEAHLERLCAVEEEKKAALEIQLSTVNNILEQTDKELQEALIEYQKKQHEDKVLQKNVEKLCNEKVSLEDAILEKLQDQITQDKATKYLNKMLRNLRNKTRDQEIMMVNTENQLTQLGLELESQRGANERTDALCQELQQQVGAEEARLDVLDAELNHIVFDVRKKQSAVDALLKKLEQLISKHGTEDLNPQELKISSLERSIAETAEKSEELQQFWMRQQSHIVQLANQRNDQLHKINIMRKQVMIMDQKNLKMEHELDCLDREDKAVSRSVAALSNKLLALNQRFCQRKDYKDALDKDNLYTHTQYNNILKDAELEAMTLKSEIHDLEQEQVELGESLLEKQRELLSWEKKLQMAQETKENTERERGKEGEVGAMKSEIHRMQVRYSQLRKAQEKLVGDLENCVARRDAIVDQTEARERKTQRAGHNTRRNFQKELQDMRNKIKHLNNELKAMDQQISDVQKRYSDLVEQMRSKEEEIQRLQDGTKQLDMQLAEGQLQRQKNLETLVRRQHKVRMCGDVKAGRYRLLYRSERALESEMQLQRTTNSQLVSVLESLLMDFPSLRLPLTRALNTLHLKLTSAT